MIELALDPPETNVNYSDRRKAYTPSLWRHNCSLISFFNAVFILRKLKLFDNRQSIYAAISAATRAVSNSICSFPENASKMILSGLLRAKTFVFVTASSDKAEQTSEGIKHSSSPSTTRYTCVKNLQAHFMEAIISDNGFVLSTDLI